MTWFKVDDGLPRSRKILSIPRSVRLSAVGLWTLAGAWSAGEELDGHVPDYMVAELGGTPRLVDALIKSGLWEAVEGGSDFSKWPEYQPTRADLEEARSKETERKRRWRERQRPASVPVGQDEGREPESGHPDPTRPDPTIVPKGTIKESVPRKRATRLDPQWNPDRPVIEEMSAECPGVDLRYEHKKFIDYWTAKSGQAATKVDWNATWRNWMRRAGEGASSSRPGPSGQKRTKREQTFIDAEMLKDNPNPDVLAQYGITPRADLKAIQGGIA